MAANFGVLLLDGKPFNPITTQKPKEVKSIEIGEPDGVQPIEWLKIKDHTYIAARPLLSCVSWKTLADCGFLDGKPAVINNINCSFRLPEYAEWDLAISLHKRKKSTLHWADAFSWCWEKSPDGKHAAIRGYTAAEAHSWADIRSESNIIAFRPILEILGRECVSAPELDMKSRIQVNGKEVFGMVRYCDEYDIVVDVENNDMSVLAGDPSATVIDGQLVIMREAIASILTEVDIEY